MKRRVFIKASMALATLSGMSGFSSLFAYAAEAPGNIADGRARAFDLNMLKKRAATLATKPYEGVTVPLPETLANMTPQAYNAIRYDAGHSLWNAIPERQLDVQFFHTGMGFKRRIRMFSVDEKSRQAREIHFNTQLFNYQQAQVDTRQLEQKPDLGFAGFRAFKVPYLASRDIVSFLGASYFRAVDETYQYGLSARGIAINTLTANQREEFPDFTEFWFETPRAEDTTFTVYALLDGPSCTGIYKFIIHCETTRVVMEVDTYLYPRKDIAQLGIAPMTTMFSCGTNERWVCDTIHPQIHDSDRLAMWSGKGEWICRPLNNPQNLTFNAFEDENPRGFGMLQLDHNFDSYQDVIGWYNKRPSLWVEPVGEWGKGAIELIEIPTTGETLDNIVCFWRPATTIKAGSERNFSYKLYWSGLPPVQSNLARVKATLTGMGGFPEGWAPGEYYPAVWARRFAIDFIGTNLNAAADKGIEPVITVSAGSIRQVEILFVEPINGYRILFDWYPDNDTTTAIDMRMYLKSGNETLSETWLYQYAPPPVEKRKYIDDRKMTLG
ncbi:MAG: Glucans biosynthesis protein D [Candidatus Erwinia impunctatus]|nr:Glucans biosynthesis protein D [Culicoides impunctatus]